MTSEELQKINNRNLSEGRREPRPNCEGCRWHYKRTLHGITESYCTFTKHNSHHADLKFGRIVLTKKIKHCPMAMIKNLAIDRNYLYDRYQNSIDSTKEPVWTDKHIEEVFEDFYLIPKR